MTTNPLDEIQARADAATDGPWELSKGEEACSINVDENRDGLYGPLTWDDHSGEVFNESDATFIAHAREDVPKLVGALRAVDALAAGWKRDYESMDVDGSPEWQYASALDDAGDEIRAAIREALGS